MSISLVMDKIASDHFQIDVINDGPYFVNKTGVLAIGVDSAAATFAEFRGKNPVGDDDYVTKNVIDAIVVTRQLNLRVVEIVIPSANEASGTFNTSTSVTFTTSDVVFRAVLDITIGYDNASAKFIIGDGNLGNRFMAVGDNDANIIDRYVVEQQTICTNSAPKATYTHTGVGTVGAGKAYLWYSNPAE